VVGDHSTVTGTVTIHHDPITQATHGALGKGQEPLSTTRSGSGPAVAQHNAAEVAAASVEVVAQALETHVKVDKSVHISNSKRRKKPSLRGTIAYVLTVAAVVLLLLALLLERPELAENLALLAALLFLAAIGSSTLANRIWETLETRMKRPTAPGAASGLGGTAPTGNAAAPGGAGGIFNVSLGLLGIGVVCGLLLSGCPRRGTQFDLASAVTQRALEDSRWKAQHDADARARSEQQEQQSKLREDLAALDKAREQLSLDVECAQTCQAQRNTVTSRRAQVAARLKPFGIAAPGGDSDPYKAFKISFPQAGFHECRSELSSDMKQHVQNVARALADSLGSHVDMLIVGFTDERIPRDQCAFASNQSLAKARADAVKEEFERALATVI